MSNSKISTFYRKRMIFFIILFTVPIYGFFIFNVSTDNTCIYFFNLFLLWGTFFFIFLKKNYKDDYFARRVTGLLGFSCGSSAFGLMVELLNIKMNLDYVLIFWLIFFLGYYFEFLYFRYVENKIFYPPKKVYTNLRISFFSVLFVYAIISYFFKGNLPDFLSLKIIHFFIMFSAFTLIARSASKIIFSRLKLKADFDILQRPYTYRRILKKS